MKIYVLAVSLCLSMVAFGQDSLKTKKDKPKEPKQEKPKEKKEKVRKMWLVGLELSRGHQAYTPLDWQDNPNTNATVYKGFIDKDSPFFTYFGANSPTYYDDQNSYGDRRFYNHYTGTYVTTSWAFKNNKGINPRHVFKLGLGYERREYSGTQYSALLGRQTDTLYYQYVNSDTIAFMKDSLVYANAQMTNRVSMAAVSVAYNYRLHPDEKLSLSFGFGFDMAFGVYTINGIIDEWYRTNTFGQSINNNFWHYQDPYGYNYKTTSVYSFQEKRFQSVAFRPFLNVRVDYRLSKKFPLLNHFNIFADGRLGVEFSNVGGKVYNYSPAYLGLRMGVSYTFFKGL